MSFDHHLADVQTETGSELLVAGACTYLAELLKKFLLIVFGHSRTFVLHFKLNVILIWTYSNRDFRSSR